MRRIQRLFLACGVLFLPSLSRSAGYQLSQAVDYFHHAQSAFDKGNLQSADTNLRLALQQLPNFSEAYLLKGLMAYSAGQTDDAQKAFDRAQQLFPRLPSAERDALQTQIKSAQDGLSQKVQGAFQIQFHGTIDPAQADVGIHDLQEALDDYSMRFGFAPMGPIPVLVFSDKEFWDEWGIPWWTRHFFDPGDGKIRFRVGAMPGGDAELRRRLRYELLRIFLKALPAPAVPEWFESGLGLYEARWMPKDAAWIAPRLAELREAVQGAPAPPLDRVEAAFTEKASSEGARFLASVDSEGGVLNLVEQKGDGWIAGLIGRLRRGEPFEKAFTQEAGVSPASALAAWRAAAPKG